MLTNLNIAILSIRLKWSQTVSSSQFFWTKICLYTLKFSTTDSNDEPTEITVNDDRHRATESILCKYINRMKIPPETRIWKKIYIDFFCISQKYLQKKENQKMCPSQRHHPKTRKSNSKNCS